MTENSPSNFWENPALNPTRPWTDTAEVRAELSHLVGGTPPERVRFLDKLLDGQPHPMTDDHAALATFFNQVAEAFGFVRLITVTKETCSLASDAVAPLRKVRSDDYRYGD